MKKILSMIGLIFSLSTFADVQIGAYQGELDDGTKCFLQINKKTYVDNFRHPLNERVDVYFEHKNQNFTLIHPPQYLVEKQRIFFNHDILAQTIPTQNGANAFLLHMAHGPLKRGPQSYEFIQDNWRNPAEKAVYNCKHLEFLKD